MNKKRVPIDLDTWSGLCEFAARYHVKVNDLIDLMLAKGLENIRQKERERYARKTEQGANRT